MNKLINEIMKANLLPKHRDIFGDRMSAECHTWGVLSGHEITLGGNLPYNYVIIFIKYKTHDSFNTWINYGKDRLLSE